MYSNFKQRKAIEAKNKKKLLEVNSDLDEKSGIYFLTRIDENNIKYCYVGQALHLLTRLEQHLVGYQHIDLSLKKHGLFSADNPYGWRINFSHCPKDKLDELERYYITLYAQNGYQSRNKDTGGGAGKQELGERKLAKGYYDGLKQGRKALAKELSNIIDKHLNVSLKPDKENNKISIRAFEKFKELLRGTDDEV